MQGDIRSRRIKLDEGGRVEGRLHMGTESAAAGQKKPAQQTDVADRSPSFSALRPATSSASWEISDPTTRAFSKW